MTVLDWIVIAGYMLGMLAIGEYYGRRNSSDQDYLLGGRNMGASIGRHSHGPIASFIPLERVKNW